MYVCTYAPAPLRIKKRRRLPAFEAVPQKGPICKRYSWLPEPLVLSFSALNNNMPFLNDFDGCKTKFCPIRRCPKMPNIGTAPPNFPWYPHGLASCSPQELPYTRYPPFWTHLSHHYGFISLLNIMKNYIATIARCSPIQSHGNLPTLSISDFQVLHSSVLPAPEKNAQAGRTL